MAGIGDDTMTICSSPEWDGAPMARDLLGGGRPRVLDVRDDRLRAPGLLSDLRSALAMRRARASAMRILKGMFLDDACEFDPSTFAVRAFVDRLGLNVLLLPPSGRIVWISIQRVDEADLYSAGHLSPRGWLWTDPHRRLSSLAARTSGSRRYAALVAA